MKQTHATSTSVWALLLAGLAGCSGAVSQAGSGGTGAGGSSAGGTVTGTGGTGPGAGGTGGGPLVMSTCAPGIPTSSQIPRLTRTQYANVVNELLGVTPPSDVMDLIPSDSSGSLNDIGWRGYLTAAEKLAALALGNATSKAKFIGCDAAQSACLVDTIKAFGRKAYRRPLTDAEVTSYMRFNTLAQTHTPADVGEAILYAFLASPTFIMVPELAETKEGAAFRLNHYEVAAKLSLLLWNSLPDADLASAADGGHLGTADEIASQAKRMLADPKAAGVAISFHHAYADINPGSHWVNVTEHDTAKFPGFTPASYNAAMAELDSFFAEVVKGGTFKDLFLSPTAFVTSDTAAIYGLEPSAFTTTPKKVDLDATKRPGFLTRAGFLSTFSHFDATSPILRGAFITGRVLNVPTGAPDPSFRNKQPPAGSYKTNREATEALTAVAPCSSCHALKVNPPGFVMERYNSIGAWQDTDQLGGAINSTAELSFDGVTTQTISAPVDLMKGIAASSNAQRFYAGMWVAFAANRPSTLNDACVVDQLAKSLNTIPTYSIASMMADFAKSDSFRLRTAGN